MTTKPFDLGAALLGNAPVVTVNGQKARIVQAPLWVYTDDAFLPYDYEGHVLFSRYFDVNSEEGRRYNLLLDYAEEALEGYPRRPEDTKPFNPGLAILENIPIVTCGGDSARIVQAPLWVEICKRYFPYNYNGIIMAEGWNKVKSALLMVDRSGGR